MAGYVSATVADGQGLIPGSGGTFTVNVTANSTFDVVLDDALIAMGATSNIEHGSADTQVILTVPKNDGDARSGVLTIVAAMIADTSYAFEVAQEAKEWTGTIPSGNASGGGTEDAPTLSGSGTRIWWRGAGAETVIQAESDVSGGVDSDGGESWRVSFKMRRERAAKFVKASALFVGSVWQPVALPSRNTPVICGWSVSYQGQIATVEINYELRAGTSYSYSTPGSPAESRHDSVSHATTERPLSECKAIFGSSSPSENAVVVEWCKKYIQAIDPTLSADERNTATDNFFAALSESEAALSKEAFLASASVKSVLSCLRSGQDSFLAYTATATRTEVLNSAPRGVGDGVGAYGTPQSSLVSGGTWLLVSDDLKQTSCGQYERVRTWQKAEIKSEAYE